MKYLATGGWLRCHPKPREHFGSAFASIAALCTACRPSSILTRSISRYSGKFYWASHFPRLMFRVLKPRLRALGLRNMTNEFMARPMLL